MNEHISKQAWLIDLATQVEADGPQVLEVEGHESLTILPTTTFEKMAARQPSLLEVLMDGPDWSELDLTRDDRPARDIEL
ncbi:hypothetical protein [Brevundimonas subvibrioides]|uniref:hypothetical protein n=1 Tax=Brevundimonas subvibrioides TaxID=74313 RepID=UPI0022B2B66A|nr:hypothetical protein [Brevundimonas subvibrioides]